MNTYYIAGFPVSDELYHFGILGMHWGERRFQNPDGIYTPAGKERYGIRSRLQARRQIKKEASAKRGEALIAKNRTRIGAVGRGAARQSAITAGWLAGTSLAMLAFAKKYAATPIKLLTNPASSALIASGTVAVPVILGGIGAGMTVANIAKVIRQRKDIKNALEERTRKGD